MLATIGTTMIARIRPAMKTPLELGSPQKSGIKPNALVQPGLDVIRRERAEHEDPPETEHDARDGGQHLDERPDHPADPAAARARVRKRAIAIASGPAITSAISEVTAVP